ncbi:MAG: hypothetical protein NTY64_10510, partial [Deltaproteobacteria bacterium]|nr:hypothetical protein [Deltaproteobacteria bacterium]
MRIESEEVPERLHSDDSAGDGFIFRDRLLEKNRNCSGSQETEFRSQNGNSGDVDELRRLLEEVSKLPAAY